ncbi:MAG: alpha-1,2-fucosyltransferase [Patescibacteria group bacterium]|nr:alpha-1,2-fucosyltransferase [Patescibacteria group bacterium]MCL5431603.1 alpha-1,2-fucosyltransferase [Patescibacteria group bacterium]
MIITRLNGGLGNQMFQYAVGRRAAVINKTVLKLDTQLFSPERNNPRNYGLFIFKIKAEPASPEEIKKIKFQRRWRLWFEKSHYWEENFKFNHEVLFSPDNSYIDCTDPHSYWQSPKYFDDIEETIRQDFSFKDRPEQHLLAIIQGIHRHDSISLHLRRDDYVHKKNIRQIFGLLGKDYYQKAISIITKNIKNPKIYIFSSPDGIEWAKRGLEINFPHVFVSELTSFSESDDLRCMAICKHNIIANSTFSWWGAWLNSNRNKTIIAPKRWFRGKPIDTTDLIPKEWIRI